jgi:hypothetical protein
VTPLGLIEELELERHAVAELEHEAAVAFTRGAYGLAFEARRDAAAARAHVAELELALAGGRSSC